MNHSHLDAVYYAIMMASHNNQTFHAARLKEVAEKIERENKDLDKTQCRNYQPAMESLK